MWNGERVPARWLGAPRAHLDAFVPAIVEPLLDENG
jgi:hypothetical protein